MLKWVPSASICQRREGTGYNFKRDAQMRFAEKFLDQLLAAKQEEAVLLQPPGCGQAKQFLERVVLRAFDFEHPGASCISRLICVA
jgi:hypothetical protein